MAKNTEIFTPQEAAEHVTCRALARTIAEYICPTAPRMSNDPRNVRNFRLYDFGCGRGEYLPLIYDRFVEMAQYGARVDDQGNEHLTEDPLRQQLIGLEGTPDLDPAWPWLVYPVDLSLPNLYLGLPGHTMSLEVGEHIHQDKLDAFVDNIARHTGPNCFSFVSWAIRGQGGRRHISCRNADEVIPMFEARGFHYCPDSTEYFRKEAGDEKFWWFKKSIYVFQRLAKTATPIKES